MCTSSQPILPEVRRDALRFMEIDLLSKKRELSPDEIVEKIEILQRTNFSEEQLKRIATNEIVA